jgi:hypothetical protein
MNDDERLIRHTVEQDSSAQIPTLTCESDRGGEVASLLDMSNDQSVDLCYSGLK